MNKILSCNLFILSIINFVFSNDQIFMDRVSTRKSRSRLKEKYERCRQRLHSDIPSNNKIENFDVSGLRNRGRFSSLDSGEDSKPISNVVRWPRGEIPVQLEAGFTKREIASLKCAILYFHAYTCLSFLKKNKTHKDYLYLMKTHKSGGCFTDVIGKKGGKQILNLDPTDDHCWVHGTIIHEIMHVLGFFHEHSRSDRNKHLVIHWNNIPKAFHFQYWTTDDMGYEHKDVGKYDYSSVMHYGRYLGINLGLSAKLHNGQYEQQVKDNDAMGQRIEPSDEDRNKINLMYCPRLAVHSIPDCQDDNTDCAGFQSLCLDAEIVRKTCKRTCGLCENTITTLTAPPTTPSHTTTTTAPSTSAKTICDDKMDCTDYITLCITDLSHEFIRENCPKTCGWCDRITCKKVSPIRAKVSYMGLDFGEEIGDGGKASLTCAPGYSSVYGSNDGEQTTSPALFTCKVLLSI